MQIDKKDQLLPPASKPDDVGKRVFEILDAIIQDRRNLNLHKKWQRNYELLKGEHFKSATGPGVPMAIANLVKLHVERTCNLLTDNDPSFNVVSLHADDVTPDQADQFEKLQRAAEHWWVDAEQQAVLAESIQNGELYDICIEKMTFNPDLAEGLGDAETVVVDPFQFGWYPVKLKSLRDLQKSEALLHFYPMRVRELARRYPDKADLIRPDEERIRELEDERREVGTEQANQAKSSMFVSVLGAVREITSWLTDRSYDGEAETLVVECWARDYTIERKGETLEQKYPGNIRYVRAACGGSVVLEDKPNPNVNLETLTWEEASKTYLFDKFPFYAANSVVDTTNAWGLEGIKQIEDLQKEFNKTLNQFFMLKNRAARRKTINPMSSGVDNSQFTNYPSIIRPQNVNEANGIRHLEEPKIPEDVRLGLELIKDLFFLLAGTFDMDRARQGIGGSREVIAYRAIAAILEQAATMMRGRVRNYGKLVRERGRCYVSMVQNYYTEPREIVYTARNGRQISDQITGTDSVTPVKLTVVSGSTMPVSKVQRREETLSLYKMGAIDREALLEQLDWPGRDEITRRMAMGPIGSILQMLQAAGVPPQILSVIQSVATTDPKEFERQLKAGKVPNLGVLMRQMLLQGPEPKDELKDLEAKRQKVEITEKEIAALHTAEKIFTERVLQQVRIAGIHYDEQQLEMERAKLAAEIRQRFGLNMPDINLSDVVDGEPGEAVEHGKPSTSRPGYNERGAQSNNIDLNTFPGGPANA